MRHGLKRVVYTPERERVLESNLTRFANRIARRCGQEGAFTRYDGRDYERLHRWSVLRPGRFWREVFEDLRLVGELGVEDGGSREWRASGSPGAIEWFPDARVNHAEILLEGKPETLEALVVTSEGSDTRRVVSYGELKRLVGALAAAMRDDGVGPGARVAGVVNNDEWAVAAMLASASLGASWSSISPDFGEVGIHERLDQVAPSVLVTHARSTYRGASHDVTRKLGGISLPSVRRCVVVGGNVDGLPAAWRAVAIDDYASTAAELSYARAGFDRPVYVMFSSGTTGRPKCMSQGVGATLGHAKEAAYHFDLRSADSAFWFSTTGWMMWNWLIGSSLATGGTAVLYDGDPTYGGETRLFELARGCALFGSSARHLAACAKAGVTPHMPSLRALGSTGSPCAPATFEWAARAFPNVPLVSTSGGTDLNGSFVTGCPWLPVREETLQCAGLGLKVDVRDADTGTRSLEAGRAGELCCETPFPSAPLAFLGDDDGTRYRATYFAPDFGGGAVWRHGDWCHRDEEGGFVVHGRSDATLNPGGVRLGTADIYNALSDASHCIVAGQPYTTTDGVMDTRVVLFVAAADDGLAARLEAAARAGDEASLIDLARPPSDLVADLATRVRVGASPRHVPHAICWCPAIPTTSNGKKLEVAVHRALSGRPQPRDDASLVYFAAVAPLIDPHLLCSLTRRTREGTGLTT